MPGGGSRSKKRRTLAEELSEYEQQVKEHSPGPAAEGADDDMLIQYLEEKLGIKGDKKKEAAFIRSVAAEEFGNDEDFLELMKTTGVDEKGEDEEDETEAEEDVDTGSGSESSQPGEEEEEKRETRPTVWKPKVLQAAQEKEDLSPINECKVAIRGGFNRVGEGNVELVSDAMTKTIFEAKDRLQLSKISDPDVGEVVKNFAEEVAKICAEEAVSFLYIKLALALAAPQSALICSLSSRVSSNVLLRFVTAVVHKFHSAFDEILEHAENDPPSEARETARQCVHAISLIAYYGFLDMDFLVEFVRYIGEHGPDSHYQMRLEILALMFRICSSELKVNYNPQYIQVESVIKSLIAEASSPSSSPSSSMHLTWIQHELANVGKHRKAPMYEKILLLKNWLRKYRGGSLDMLEPKRCLQQMLKNELPDLDSDPPASDLTTTTTTTSDARLRKIAKELQIRSPLQQDIFIAMAEAKSVPVAMNGILKCVSTSKNVEPAIAVILHCALKEKTYNPYYTELTSALCSMPDLRWRKYFKRALKRAFFLLTTDEEAGVDPERLKTLLDALKDDLEPQDYTKLRQRRIFG